MSNNRTDLAELDVTNEDMKEMLGDNATAAIGKPVAKKHVMSRIWAVLLLVAPVALLCVLPTLLFVGQEAGYAIYGEKTLLDAMLAIVKQFAGKDGIKSFYADIPNAPSSFDGYSLAFLPLLNNAGFVGKIYSVGFYAIPLAIVLNLIFAIVALCSAKAAPKMTRAIAFVDLFAFGSYLLAILGFGKYYGIEIEYLSLPVYVLGGIVAASLVFYLVYALAKTKGTGVVNLVLLLLSAVFVASYAYAYFFVEGPRAILTLLYSSTDKALIPALTEGKLLKYTALAVGGIGVVTLFFGAVRVSSKKGFTFDLVRYIVNILLSAVVLILSFTTEEMKVLDLMKWNMFAIVSSAIAAIQIDICIIALKHLKKKKKACAKLAAEKVAEEQAQEQEQAPVETEEEQTEATAEPIAYEVTAEKIEEQTETATEESAEEPVQESVESEESQASIETEAAPVEETKETPVVAAYDFYSGNCKNFDPFVASLNDKERKQFTDLFILKTQGELKNLPDYEVGGNNKEFFRKIFIYLGQYRELIPSGLLAKIYNFTSKK